MGIFGTLTVSIKFDRQVSTYGESESELEQVGVQQVFLLVLAIMLAR